ncbi:RNA methyltransferase [Bacteroidota bacterium]
MRKLLNEELNRLSIDAFKEAEKLPVVIILDNVRSMNNVGSVFRTADAFRIQSIALCGITAVPPNKEIHKTALGATDSVHWEYFDNTLEAVKYYKNMKYLICAVEQVDQESSLEDFLIEDDKSYALVFGHEIHGVAQEIVDVCDVAIEIPQYGTKHSLNISVSAGITLWEFYKKLAKEHILSQ